MEQSWLWIPNLEFASYNTFKVSSENEIFLYSTEYSWLCCALSKAVAGVWFWHTDIIYLVTGFPWYESYLFTPTLIGSQYVAGYENT